MSVEIVTGVIIGELKDGVEVPEDISACIEVRDDGLICYYFLLEYRSDYDELHEFEACLKKGIKMYDGVIVGVGDLEGKTVDLTKITGKEMDDIFQKEEE